MSNTKNLASVAKALTDTRFHTVRHVDTTGSTNDDLLCEAAEGAETGLVVVADHQTNGKGRLQRAWHDNNGEDLLVSVLLREQQSPSLSILPLLVALSAHDAINTVTERPLDESLVTLKWPNDVVTVSTPQAKLAGILIESVPGNPAEPDERCYVIGLGINISRTLPAVAGLEPHKITSLSELVGVNISREQILKEFLGCLEHWLGWFESGDNNTILNSYRRRCSTLGQQVRVDTLSGRYSGKAVDVLEHGELSILTEYGIRKRVTSGDVHHCRLVDGDVC